MPELVDLLAPVLGADEAHLGEQDLRLEHWRVGVESCGAGVARVADQWDSHLARDRDAGLLEVANLVAR